MKVYLDNNVVSSISKDDNKTQSDALTRLLEAHEQRRVQLVTSEITLEDAPKPTVRPWNERFDSSKRCRSFDGLSWLASTPMETSLLGSILL
jgi:hypothetical protein